MKLLNEVNLEEVLSSDKNVVLYFTAKWCGPCRGLAPEIEAYSAQVQDQTTVIKVDIMEEKHTSEQYNIRSIPTVVVFKNDNTQERFVGRNLLTPLKNFLD